MPQYKSLSERDFIDVIEDKSDRDHGNSEMEDVYNYKDIALKSV